MSEIPVSDLALPEPDDFADEIVDQSKNNAYSSFTVLESFSKTVTSLALFANGSWPLVTLPHFEIRASDYLDISGAQQIAFAPIVQDDSRESWEAMREAGVQRVRERHDWSRNVDRYLSVYQRLLTDLRCELGGPVRPAQNAA